MPRSLNPSRLRWAVASLYVLSSVLLAIGTNIESESGGEDREAGGSAEVAEARETDRDEPETSGTGGGLESHDEGDEEILGVNPESPLLLASAVLVSLALAAAVLGLPGRRAVAGVAAMAAIAFAAFDMAEVARQAGEDNTSLAALGGGIALLHALASLGAVALLVSLPRPGSPRRSGAANAA